MIVARSRGAEFLKNKRGYWEPGYWEPDGGVPVVYGALDDCCEAVTGQSRVYAPYLRKLRKLKSKVLDIFRKE